jgi:hypothetical protein
MPKSRNGARHTSEIGVGSGLNLGGSETKSHGIPLGHKFALTMCSLIADGDGRSVACLSCVILGEGHDGGIPAQVHQCYLYSERGLQTPSHHLKKAGIASQIVEVVVKTDFIETQNFFPNARDCLGGFENGHGDLLKAATTGHCQETFSSKIRTRFVQEESEKV